MIVHELCFNIPVNNRYSFVFDTSIPVGCRVEATLGRRKQKAIVLAHPETPPKGYELKDLKPIEKQIDEEPLVTDELINLAEFISGYYFCSVGEALFSMIPGGKREKEIQQFAGDDPVSSREVVLSDEQNAALDAINQSPGGMFYLYGITGSGKTEVFMQAARHVLNQGRSVIYLVPEIALTGQVVDVIKSRFPEEVAVLHSRLTPSQRLKEWRRLMRGEALFAVGARSAVFAPVANPGLIIIDEEHESAYKSGNTPRYHARQVAMKRIHTHNAKLVMGSATPSIEAWHLMQEKRIQRLNLTKRLAGGTMPEIQIIDVRNEDSAISKDLHTAILHTTEQKGQVILFLNRRGFSYFFHCNNCGYEMKCRRCSVSLTYHKEHNNMKCHYCGYSTQPVKSCPDCGSIDVGYAGFGTEKIEEDVQRLFPNLKVARVDTDSVKKKGSLEQTIADFREGKIDILLGTQMVAKGLNFPGVKLVGILLADTGLHMPDFRAAERTFSLIQQVAGRAGRYTSDGKVYLQTYMPKNRTIYLASTYNQDEFYKSELNVREMLSFPPYKRLIRLVVRSKDRYKVQKAIDQIEHILAPCGDDVEILGPSECPIAVINGSMRQQVLLRGDKINLLQGWAARVKEQLKLPSSTYLEIDIDPVSLL